MPAGASTPAPRCTLRRRVEANLRRGAPALVHWVLRTERRVRELIQRIRRPRHHPSHAKIRQRRGAASRLQTPTPGDCRFGTPGAHALQP